MQMLCMRHCCCYYTIPNCVVAQIKFIHTFDESAICHWLQLRRDQDVTQMLLEPDKEKYMLLDCFSKGIMVLQGL